MKSTKMRVSVLFAIGLGVFLLAQAGDLEPPGPPGPTMVTLQEISDKLDSLGTGVVGVPKTGQTQCWDESGNVIGCAGTGQDGEIQAGVSVDPRFTDNLDGTVRDNLTGLIWLKNANCFSFRNWTDALSDAKTLAENSCGLMDGSVAGDWRLPNLRELESLFDYGNVNPALPTGHPFSGVQLSNYWVSTTREDFLSFAWIVGLNNGSSTSDMKIHSNFLWPVRGRQ